LNLDIELIKELIAEREKIDAQLASLFTADVPRATARKSQSCSHCGETGHTTRSCSKKSETPLA
jgi:hypothetical protein